VLGSKSCIVRVQELFMSRKLKTGTTTSDIEKYLSKLSTEQRVALEKLRKSIKAAAPKAEECICYQMPSFRLGGKYLVSFAAWKKHCAFYPGSLALKVNWEAVKSYDVDKGTIRFLPENLLPATLVRKLVKTRIAQVVR
jgi:uncharacterized protein YdhG (YjbR/CyaY superfamily)